MSSMVERVARSLREASPTAGRGNSHLRSQPLTEDMCIDLALAAIKAMREPTEAMRLKIAHEDWNGSKDLNWTDGWQIMIDAALSEPSP